MFDQSYERRLLVPQSSTRRKSLVHPFDINVDVLRRMPSSPDIWGTSTTGPQWDRFIHRRTAIKRKFLFPMIQDRETPSDKSPSYSTLLRNELFGTENDNVQYGRESRTVSSVHHNPVPLTPSSPLSSESQLLLRTAPNIRKPHYNLNMDPPGLADIYFMDLLDWSYQNMLVLALETGVFLYNPVTDLIEEFFSLTPEEQVTSVSFNDHGNYLATGSNDGLTQVWDVETERPIMVMEGHTRRIGCLAWNESILCSGSRDRLILLYDIRTPENITVRRLEAHQKEVCGLKWSPYDQYLASGGNDNKLYIWSLHSPRPLVTFPKQKAAVKALAWSPHHRSLLASGGASADQHIMFWDTSTGQLMKSVDTGSEVCNLVWAKHAQEIISTHGKPFNETTVWKYPELIKAAKLPGALHRVLHLAISPDGELFVTGAHEKLAFWRLYSTPQAQKKLFGIIR